MLPEGLSETPIQFPFKIRVLKIPINVIVDAVGSHFESQPARAVVQKIHDTK